MAFADDLLDQARHLSTKEPRRPKQASLRRAVSTAYYALFHLLIAAAVDNWKTKDQRDRLARVFNHRTMKTASDAVAKEQFPDEDRSVVDRLKNVARAFVQPQQQRHTADYDNSHVWSRSEALDQVDLSAEAFEDWRAVHSERIAQEYLVSFFGVRR